jgi:F0F1-type ATP synthase membrane subunit c/vacuolar-type H+-ATPase subunit K
MEEGTKQPSSKNKDLMWGIIIYAIVEAIAIIGFILVMFLKK